MAINDVSLTAGMRNNLVSLQGTVDLLNRTQERLSTGKKVNTALDNPLNYFTSKALNSRASDLAGYKDGMSEAVQTIKAANTGISAIEGLLAQAKAVAATAKAGTANVISSITVDLASVTAGQTISIGGQTLTAVASDNWTQKSLNFTAITFNDTITIGSTTYTASTVDSASTFIVNTANMQFSATTFLAKIGAVGEMHTGATTAAATIDMYWATSASTVTENGSGTAVSTSTVTAVGSNMFSIAGTNGQDATNLANAITAACTTVTASAAGAKVTVVAATGAATLTAASVTTGVTSMTEADVTIATADRLSYATQFNDIMNQLDLVATDSGYKGINFLAAGNTLDVDFGATTGDKITLNGFDASAAALLAKTDGTKTADHSWATNANVDVDIVGLAAATATLKTQSSNLSSGLSIINTRQDWVKGMVNTLTEGSDKLTLADMNEEGANMLMLQTRQTLGTTALSLSAQAAQSVLRLFA
jgi:flagellin-like hook-associated protein FlgL